MKGLDSSRSSDKSSPQSLSQNEQRSPSSALDSYLQLNSSATNYSLIDSFLDALQTANLSLSSASLPSGQVIQQLLDSNSTSPPSPLSDVNSSASLLPVVHPPPSSKPPLVPEGPGHPNSPEISPPLEHSPQENSPIYQPEGNASAETIAPVPRNSTPESSSNSSFEDLILSLNNDNNLSTDSTPNSQILNHSKSLSSSSFRNSSYKSKESSYKSKEYVQGVLVGVIVAVVLIISLVSIVCFILKRKRRRLDADTVLPQTPYFSANTDWYFTGQPSAVNPPHADPCLKMEGPAFFSHGSCYGSHKGHARDSGSMGLNARGNPKSCFTFDELNAITDGFSHQNVLSKGEFGCVYLGQLADGSKVAVKQLSGAGGQNEREFRAEVEIIGRVHHRHLVMLKGYCLANHQRFLVYEFVPNNTLEHHLHGKAEVIIEWSDRVKIAIGAAKGLAYLHEDCHPRIIHRDITSANILLDNSFEAKVADFGLAKLTNDSHTHVSTRVVGSFGYVAPEYASSGKLTDRCDVFSFGVVLLELLTGRKAVDASRLAGRETLAEWARPHLIHALETGDFGELVDPRLENNYKTGEVLRMIEVTAGCIRHSASNRPRMVQVARALDSRGGNGKLDTGNRVKFSQSTTNQGSKRFVDIRRFQQLAFGSSDYRSDYGPSGEYDQKSSAYSAFI